MERERIVFFRNFLFSAFIIGLVFALFYFAASMLLWDTAVSWATHLFKIDEKNSADWFCCSSSSCAS